MDVHTVSVYLQKTGQVLRWETPPNWSGKRYVPFDLYGRFEISGLVRVLPFSRIEYNRYSRDYHLIQTDEKLIQASFDVTDCFYLISENLTSLRMVRREELLDLVRQVQTGKRS